MLITRLATVESRVLAAYLLTARDFDLGGGFHYTQVVTLHVMVFQHSGARDFDLGGGIDELEYGGLIEHGYN